MNTVPLPETAPGSPALSASEPAEKPFLTVAFFRKGGIEYTSEPTLMPETRDDLRAVIGTTTLVLQEILDWAKTQMKVLILREHAGDALTKFLETWEGPGEAN